MVPVLSHSIGAGGPIMMCRLANRQLRNCNYNHRAALCCRHRAECGAEILKEREAAKAGAQMGYPPWLIIAGTVLLAIGFIGLAFRRNRDIEPKHEPMEMKANEKRDGGDSDVATLPAWPWRPPRHGAS